VKRPKSLFRVSTANEVLSWIFFCEKAGVDDNMTTEMMASNTLFMIILICLLGIKNKIKFIYKVKTPIPTLPQSGRSNNQKFPKGRMG